MTKKQRAELFAATNGRCGYCGTSLDGVRWHADHMEPVLRESKLIRGKGFVQTGKMERPENDHIGNMMAACPQCNILKHCQDVEGFRATIADRTRQLELQSAYRTAKRYGMVVEVDMNIVFYLETLANELALA